ncbi:MAG: hypothetical protein ILP18_12020 [Treponema sp.]|nr:hypothetical protein [Treponema sp.]
MKRQGRVTTELLDSAARRILRSVEDVFFRVIRRAVAYPLRGNLFLRMEKVFASSRPEGVPRRAVPEAAAPCFGFPAAGNRNGTGVNNVGNNGNYWSSSVNSEANARTVNFNSGTVNPQNNNNRRNGFSVRLSRASILLAVLLAAALLLLALSFLFSDHSFLFAAAAFPVAGPWGRPPRTHQVPFRESMGAERFERALREEHRSQAQQAFLEEHLFGLLYDAYLLARESNRNTYAQCAFEMFLFMKLSDLKRELLDGTYRPSRCIIFIVTVPVKREVIAPAFRDEVVDHLLYVYLYPVFDPLFIYDSYSCRVGKGTSLGIARLEHHIRSVSQNYTREAFVLLYDLSGYFMSIDHCYLYDVTVNTLVRKGHRRDMLYPLMAFLTRLVIFTDPTVGCLIRGQREDWIGLPANKSYFNCAPGKGLPIGRLPCQLFSNINLMEYDNFLKRDLQAEHAGHYVDDYFAVLRSRREAETCMESSRAYLAERPRLKVHPHKVRIAEVHDGVPFLGVVVRQGRRTVCRRAQTLMAGKFCDVLTEEEDVFHLDACRASVQGHLLGKRSNRVESLAFAREW